MEGLDGPALNTNYPWVLGIHEHEAPTKERLLSEVVESVVTKLRNEDFIGSESLLMPLVDFLPVLLDYVVEHDIHSRLVVANKNVSIIHVQRIHVGMGVKDLVRNIFGKPLRLLL